MEITSGLVYWITRLDALKAAFAFVVAMLAIAGGVTAQSIFENNDKIRTESLCNFHFDRDGSIVEDAKRRLSRAKTLMWIFSILMGLSILSLVSIPSTKEMCAILIIPKIANSECVEKGEAIVPELLDKAKLWIDSKKD